MLTTLQTEAKRLRIGGVTALSTIDYPGELAAVVYCQGCPWRCRYCHNGHLLTAEADAPIAWDQLRGLLERRQGLLDGVVFSGGEPTAQRALPAAMREIRALGYKIGLHTSGAYPERLHPLLPLVDWVGLDIKALPEDYPLVTGASDSGNKAWHSLRLLLDADIALEVRTTPMPGLDDTDYLNRLLQRLAGEGVGDYALQQCRTAYALDRQLPDARELQVADWAHQPFKHFKLRQG
ncbi:MAG TPA: anaerobic ribonucleoside-triphosphate reductase activating protein [Chromatiaceae bacterium]|jgi:pyruvate formate lyase activating enzyme|nr:MAG: hypothetical protein N838_02570 [Thiohalocapsa sp. PB-PSB1]QQO52832.1 MAG: anaerobic ribonucleoside-triphosphate reductase activating protein [Thiohalocapsa sp. PB-PSB1]HBG95803.1 anaerobic ribonucleoside-triphosphate reductase activating protein [Chromatiaceae bacterium]HCS91373.1 anaerobic ribonucleoside-triphosphate reductase activating protein [Chromatiaceae bacterium]